MLYYGKFIDATTVTLFLVYFIISLGMTTLLSQGVIHIKNIDTVRYVPKTFHDCLEVNSCANEEVEQTLLLLILLTSLF